MSNNAASAGGVYKTLDGWRGVAALWVVFYHATGSFVQKQGMGSGPLYQLALLGYLGVEMFFVISGYCIVASAASAVKKGGTWQAFFQARLRRIFPPCWASLIFYALFAATASLLAASGRLHESSLASSNILHRAPIYYLSTLTLTQLIFHQDFLSIVCWTLCYELAFYFIVGACLILALRTGGVRLLLNTLHGITLTALLILIMAPHRAFYPLDFWPQFGLGILVYDVLRHPKEILPKILFVLAGIGTVTFALLYNLSLIETQAESRTAFLAALGFAVLALALYRHDERLSRFRVVQAFSTLGIFSYSLYLTHYLVIGTVSQAAHLLKIEGWKTYIAFAFAVLTALALGRIFHHFFERPFMKSALRPASKISANKPLEAPEAS